MSNDKKLIAAGVLFGLGLFFFASVYSKRGENKVTFGQVEDIRKETMLKSRMERQRVEVQNFKTAPALGSGIQKENNQMDRDGLTLESSRNHAAADSYDTASDTATPATFLESQTNKLLANKQHYEHLTQMQKKRFIAEYQRKALAMGYLVELDDKLNIVKVQRAPASQKPQYQPSEPVDVDQMDVEDDEMVE